MNLTELATHICEQCGMQDDGDTDAAKMFLQRRFEMIWNGALWRASMLEAVMTIDTDGTVDLADTVWIPSRSTLLLPPELATVVAVRTSRHTLNVASLESYYRQDTNLLDTSGDPAEFQLLRPAVWEFATATDVYLESDDVSKAIRLIYSSNGVRRENVSAYPEAIGATSVAEPLVIYGVTKAATTAAVSVLDSLSSVIPAGEAYTTPTVPPGIYYYTISGLVPGVAYTVTMGNAVNLYSNTYAGPIGATVILTADGTFTPVAGLYYCLTGPTDGGATGPYPPISITATITDPTAAVLTLAATDTVAPIRQRVRLTAIPTQELTLRVLGKTDCPVLDDYDTIPINNAETCLMAFARGDMLLRQRQHGKAQLAQQEGTALLAALQRSEAYQQAQNFRIMPENGFGSDYYGSAHDHIAPL